MVIIAAKNKIIIHKDPYEFNHLLIQLLGLKFS